MRLPRPVNRLRGWQVFLLPLAEILLFRHWINIENGPPFSPLSALAAFLAAWIFLSMALEERPVSPCPRWVFAWLSLLLAGLFAGAGMAWAGWAGFWGGGAARLAWYSAALSALSAAFLFWLPLKEWGGVVWSQRGKGVFLIVAVFAFPLMEGLQHFLWRFFSQPTLHGVAALLQATGMPFQPGGGETLAYPGLLEVRIAAECSGFEGMAFFLIAFSLDRIFAEPGEAGAGRTAWLYAAGLGYMFLLNLLRIALILWVAAWMAKRWGGDLGAKSMVWAFHAHAGWVLYFSGIGLFLWGTGRRGISFSRTFSAAGKPNRLPP